MEAELLTLQTCTSFVQVPNKVRINITLQFAPSDINVIPAEGDGINFPSQWDGLTEYEGAVRMRSVRTITWVVGMLLGVSPAIATETWVTKREAVAEGESYLRSSSQQWQTRCVRLADSQDSCFAVAEIKGAIPVELALGSFSIEKRKVEADVDVVPVGILDVSSATSAKLDKELYAGIDSLDGIPFDGYLCKLVDTSDCLRGPNLEKSSWQNLLSARTAQVSFFKKVGRKIEKNSPLTTENFTLEKLDSVTVSLAGLRRSIASSEKQMAAMQNLPAYSKPVEVKTCTANIKGDVREIRYVTNEQYADDKTSWRETIFGPKGLGDCPSYVTLAYLTPDISRSQRALFCLAYDKQATTYRGVGQGAHDAYNLCKAPPSAFCERVSAAKNKALALTSVAAATVVTSNAGAAAAGVTVVMHSSGAAILTGSAGYIAGTLGTLGVTALGVATAPVTAVAAGVSVLSLGSAIMVCR